MSNVLTWAADPAADGTLAVSERLRAIQRSHHAMWNYVTYRDAIALVGLDAEDLYPEGTTRLPADWADLGWLTCFAGPPESAVAAMRAAVEPDALDMYAPDLIEPLRDAAAGVLGRERDAAFEVVGTEGAQAGLALALMASVDPGDEVILGDPGYFHLPPAVIAAGGRPVAVPLGAETGFRLDPDRVAAAITPRTRAICLIDPVNPYGTVARADEVGGAGPPRRAPRGPAHRRRDARAARDRPGERAASGGHRLRAGGRDVLGVALLRHGRRADRLPRGPARADARLPAAEGRPDPPEHEPDLAARRARGPARRGLPRVRPGDDPREPRPPRGDARATSPACASRSGPSAASRARSTCRRPGRARRR